MPKRDPLQIVSYSFADFNGLLSARRQQNKNAKNFESQQASWNAHGSSTIFQSLIALLFSNSNIDENQRPSFLAFSFKSITLGEDCVLFFLRKERLAEVKYDLISSVLRQCDQNRVSKASSGEQKSLPTNRTGDSNGRMLRGSRTCKKRTPAELAD